MTEKEYKRTTPAQYKQMAQVLSDVRQIYANAGIEVSQERFHETVMAALDEWIPNLIKYQFAMILGDPDEEDQVGLDLPETEE